ncbi:MAG: hypothetical protein JNM43_21055 [Planctomycetaceae bacterium]|nr:hypothetical protein [Planctomycetaceae bacterium]
MKHNATSCELVSSREVVLLDNGLRRRYLPVILTIGVLLSVVAVLISRHESSQTISRLQYQLTEEQQKSRGLEATREMMGQELSELRETIAQSKERDNRDLEVLRELQSNLTTLAEISASSDSDQDDRISRILQASYRELSNSVPRQLPELLASDVAHNFGANFDAEEIACRKHAARTMSALGGRLAREGLSEVLFDSEIFESGAASEKHIALLLEARSTWLASLDLRHDLPPEAWSLKEFTDYIEDAESVVVLAMMIEGLSDEQLPIDGLLRVLDTGLGHPEVARNPSLQKKLAGFVTALVENSMNTEANVVAGSVLRRMAEFAERQSLQSPFRTVPAQVIEQLAIDAESRTFFYAVAKMPVVDLTECYFKITAQYDQPIDSFQDVVERMTYELGSHSYSGNSEELCKIYRSLIHLLSVPRFDSPHDAKWKPNCHADLYSCLSRCTPDPAERRECLTLAIRILEGNQTQSPNGRKNGLTTNWDYYSRMVEHHDIGQHYAELGDHKQAVVHFTSGLRLIFTGDSALEPQKIDYRVHGLISDAKPSLIALLENGEAEPVREFIKSTLPGLVKPSESDDLRYFEWSQEIVAEIMLKLGDYEQSRLLIAAIGEQQLDTLLTGNVRCGHPLEVLNESGKFVGLSAELLSKTKSADDLLPLLEAWTARYEQVCQSPASSLAETLESKHFSYSVSGEVVALCRALNECNEARLARSIGNATVSWIATEPFKAPSYVEVYLQLAASNRLLGDGEASRFWLQRVLSELNVMEFWSPRSEEDQLLLAKYHFSLRNEGYSWEQIVACNRSALAVCAETIGVQLAYREDWGELESFVAALEPLSVEERIDRGQPVVVLLGVSKYLLSLTKEGENSDDIHKRALKYLDRSMTRSESILWAWNDPFWINDADCCLLVRDRLLCDAGKTLPARSIRTMALGIVHLKLDASDEGQQLLVEGLSDYFQLHDVDDITPDLTHLISDSEYCGLNVLRAAMLALVEHLKQSGKADEMHRWATICQRALKEHYLIAVSTRQHSIHEYKSDDLLTLRSLYDTVGNPAGAEEVESLRQRVLQIKTVLQEILESQSLESIDLEQIEQNLAKQANLDEAERQTLRSHLPAAVADYLTNSDSVSGRTLAEIREILQCNTRDADALTAALYGSERMPIGRFDVSELCNCIGGIELDRNRKSRLVYGSAFMGCVVRKFDGSPEYELLLDVFGEPSFLFCVQESPNVLAVIHDVLVEISTDGRSVRKFQFSHVPKQVAVSRDGKHFAWCDEEPGRRSTVRIGTLGESLIKVVGEGQDPMWSTDGDKLYFLDADRTGFNVRCFSDDQTSDIGHIDTSDHIELSAVLSPDNSRILYVEDSDRGSIVRSFHLETQATSPLFTTAVPVKQLSLSPDGEFLCYLVGDHSWPAGLFVFDLLTQTKSVICTYPGSCRPAWSY